MSFLTRFLSTAKNYKDLNKNTDDTNKFQVYPVDDDLKGKGTTAIISVTPQGFSVDKNLGKDDDQLEQWPLLRVPMEHVHSWIAIGGHFCLRHHAPSGKMLVHTFEMVKGKDLDKLMDAVDRAVGTFKATKESIMQSKALTDEEFTNLIETLDAVELDLRVPGIKGVLDKEGGKSISFEQSKRLLTLVEESFDRIEAACFLYARLIDISDRNKLLAELDSADRETVEMLVKEKKMMEKHELDTINPTFEGLTI